MDVNQDHLSMRYTFISISRCRACEAELALLTDRIQQSWKDSGIQQSPEHVLGIIRQRSTDSMPGANKTEVIQDIMDEMDRILQDILTEEVDSSLGFCFLVIVVFSVEHLILLIEFLVFDSVTLFI